MSQKTPRIIIKSWYTEIIMKLMSQFPQNTWLIETYISNCSYYTAMKYTKQSKESSLPCKASALTKSIVLGVWTQRSVSMSHNNKITYLNLGSSISHDIYLQIQALMHSLSDMSIRIIIFQVLTHMKRNWSGSNIETLFLSHWCCTPPLTHRILLY